MKLRDLEKIGVYELQKKEIEEPRRKVKVLLTFLKGIRVDDWICFQEEEAEEELVCNFYQKLEKLKQGYPIQYMTGKQEFMKKSFWVSPDVLIPQPDTEILVEETLAEIGEKSFRILDLCTGSGCIGISIASYARNIQKVVMSDVSLRALEIAKKNAQNNHVFEKVELVQSNLFENIQGKFDGIVSNPPYIPTDVIGTLSKEVQNEPSLALDGGKDGLAFYKRILEKADLYLNPGGFLFLEIGYDQKEALRDLWNKQMQRGKTKLTNFQVKQDLAGLDRIVLLRSEKK